MFTALPVGRFSRLRQYNGRLDGGRDIDPLGGDGVRRRGPRGRAGGGLGLNARHGHMFHALLNLRGGRAQARQDAGQDFVQRDRDRDRERQTARVRVPEENAEPPGCG